MKMVQNIKEHKQTNLQLLIFWENDKVPTKVGVSLSLSQWKVLCSATQVVDDLISRAKDGEPVDWRYSLGEDVYVIIKAPSTDNSHQEALRTSWRMAIASYEDRSDPESLRIEITETDHPIVGRQRDRTKNNGQ
jgi:hypothetical protein